MNPVPPVQQVQPGSFLTLHYRLAGPDGAVVIDTFADPPATLSLGSGQLAPAMEQRLVGLAEGARARFELEPGEDWALFDFNHPLAGQPLSFEVHVIGVL